MYRCPNGAPSLRCRDLAATVTAEGRAGRMLGERLVISRSGMVTITVQKGVHSLRSGCWLHALAAQ